MIKPLEQDVELNIATAGELVKIHLIVMQDTEMDHFVMKDSRKN